MASGWDPRNSATSSKRPLIPRSTASPGNTAVWGEQRESRHHEGEDQGEEVTGPHNLDSPESRDTRREGDRQRNYRPGQQFYHPSNSNYQGYRNPGGDSSWTLAAQNRGATASSSWRNSRGRGVQGSARSFHRPSSYFETTPFDSYGAGNITSKVSSTGNRQPMSGEGIDAASWRNTKTSKDERGKAYDVEGCQDARSRSHSTPNYRRPGGPTGQTSLDTNEDHENEDNDVITQAFFRRPGKTQLNKPKDLFEREDNDLLPRYESTEGNYRGESSSDISDHTNNDEPRRQRRQDPQPSTQVPHKTQRNIKTPPFSEQDLLAFLDGKPSEVLSELVRRKEKCLALFSEDDLNDQTLILTVRVLSCMCYLDPVSEPIWARELKIVLGMIESSLFLSKHLTRYLVGLSNRQEVDDGKDVNEVQTLASDVRLILKLLHLFLENNSSGFSEVGVVLILLQRVVAMAALNNDYFDPEGDLMTEVEQLKDCCHSLEESQRTARRRAMEKPPPNNFRDISIFPESTELRQTTKPFLRKNIVRGRYEHVEHYLDVQFRLLREDFVGPLREGITGYLSDKTGRLRDISVYYNVSIEMQKMAKNGLITHTLKFHMRGRRPERWEHSKRFLYGSFVCLSRDDFKHILCATVENRKVEDLEQGLVDVRFQTKITGNEGPFIMAESAAYFEAYRHVLQGLQQMNEDNFPFKKYIVDVASSVHPPVYLRGDGPVLYDLRPLVVSDQSCDDDIKTKTIIDAAYVPILEPESWPTAEDLHLDESQKAALQAALTNEFTIIQGPPGTGKTYIGLKIIEVLLDNCRLNYSLLEEANESPILVVCYTNHALDQFLEGILAFGEEHLVRVGSRSSSEVLEEKNISSIRRNKPHSKFEYREKMLTLESVRKQLEKIDEEIECILLKLDLPRKAILDVMVLKDYMDQYSELSHQMTKGYQPSEDPSANLLKWLNIEVTEEKDHSHVTEQTQEGSQGGEDDRIQVEDEVDEIQKERQLDDNDLGIDREQRRQALEDNIFRQYAAHDSEIVLISTSKAELLKTDAMTIQEASRIRRIWILNMCDRWRLYRLWVKKYKEDLSTELNEHRQIYETLKEEMDTLNVQEDLEILREANVIGMTTTGAAKHRMLLQRLGPRIVLVEEAAEVLEAHIITTLTANCQHLILIGDHQQLKPNPTVYRLAKMFNLDTSLFERMIKNGVPYKSLTHQHRMRPEISQVMKKHFYMKLQDDESVLKMENIKGMMHNMFFIDHQCLEDSVDDNRTRSNQYEAEVLVALCRYLLHQGYEPSQITVLTTYKGQLFCFRRLMDRETFEGVRVCVVDNYQGEENDIILLSLVRSNEEGSIGFLRTSNRVCVALSRAKMGFYCIGNASILKKAQIWQDIIGTLAAENRIGSSLSLVCQNHPSKITQVATVKDFKEKSPCGGCDKSCVYKLNCGHVCHLFCHPYDPDHKYECQKPCARFCKRGEHLCPLKCHQVCRPCLKKVPKSMPECGHEIQVCCDEFYMVTCTEPCPRIFEVCRHRCRKKCGQSCPTLCPEKCEKALGCGHPCTVTCGEPCTKYCKVQVRKALPKCGHNVIMDCSELEVPCPEPCPKLFEVCGHRCRKKCGQSCPTLCPEKCEKALGCGHPCTVTCGEPCTKYCKVQVRKALPKCGHNVVMDCSELEVPCPEPCPKLFEVCGHHCRRKCGETCVDMCPEMCEKTLACGHPCTAICSSACTNYCNVQVEKTLPKCFHNAPVDCSENIEYVACKTWVTKTHPNCGHNVILACCKDPGTVKCKQFVNKIRSCGHQRNMPCFIDPNAKECKERCEKTLRCGHQCPNMCEKPCELAALPVNSFVSYKEARAALKVCEVIVEKSYPSCAHTIKVPCHESRDLSLVPCSRVCEKLLACGHPCPNKCGVPCPRLSTKCKNLVERTLPNCGHSVTAKCYQSLASLSCSENCNKELPCGHICRNKCSVPCKCSRKVIKTLPNCEHTVRLPCFQDVKSYLCVEECQKELVCGHQCPNECGEPCPVENASSNVDGSRSNRYPQTRCEKIVSKTLPCGHAQDVTCWQADSAVCRESCTAIIDCGHKCSGDCKSCKQGTQHIRCENRCKRQLLCGHICRSNCYTLCSPYCLKCESESMKHVSRSKQPCSLDKSLCRHNMRHRQLRSNACILPCTRKLTCKHTCIGICGEPCPPFCGVCKRELLPMRSFSNRVRFIYLQDCGHLCDARFLDRMVASVKNSLESGCVEIRSLLCPKCKEPIHNCPRYDDLLKVISTSVNAAKLKCKKKRQEASVSGFDSWGDDRATASMAFAVGRWMRCPQGHVFCQEEDGKQGQQKQEPLCPEC